LCVSKCGAIATIEDGAFVALAPDPSHPTGQAVCIKGKAAPEVVNHADRLLHPLKRTAPKGAADPGWQQIGWDGTGHDRGQGDCRGPRPWSGIGGVRERVAVDVSDVGFD
jgi:anaerobic selenocysteine-containing dehydrogenase